MSSGEKRVAWLATNLISGGFPMWIARFRTLGDRASSTRAA
jgi:hypothetical protein